jgi:hypothetical protein
VLPRCRGALLVVSPEPTDAPSESGVGTSGKPGAVQKGLSRVSLEDNKQR